MVTTRIQKHIFAILTLLHAFKETTLESHFGLIAAAVAFGGTLSCFSAAVPMRGNLANKPRHRRGSSALAFRAGNVSRNSSSQRTC